MVELLVLAHERACEAELAGMLEDLLHERRLPDLAALRAHFLPDAQTFPRRHCRHGAAWPLRRPGGHSAGSRRMTKTTDPVDATRLALLLGELRLPAIKAGWKHVADRADKEGWPAARFLRHPRRA